MSKAQDFLDEFWRVLDGDAGYNGKTIEDYVEEKLKEAKARGRREENEACAKLKCPLCGKGDTPFIEEGKWVHDTKIPYSCREGCHAADIRTRLEGK